MVAAVAWPVIDGYARGIVGFVSGLTMETDAIKDALKKRLPAYMVPSIIHCINDMPLTANGKVDRKRLRDFMKDRENL